MISETLFGFYSDSDHLVDDIRCHEKKDCRVKRCGGGEDIQWNIQVGQMASLVFSDIFSVTKCAVSDVNQFSLVRHYKLLDIILKFFRVGNLEEYAAT